MDRLPVDDRLDAVLAPIRAGRDVVLEAPPGSGKTTRVPPALLDARLDGGGGVIVLEPRRLAVRMAARRVAEERGVEVGGEVGYQVRFERRASKRTRLLFLTEGLLTRRLLADAELPGVSVVVFDEFHERSLHTDLTLGLVREVQSALRPDLRMVVMSATLDAEAVAREIGAEVVRAEGRRFPVEVEFASRRDPSPVAVRAARAVLEEIDRDGGHLREDTLVFLPGVGEIRRAADELRGAAAQVGFDVRPLYGDLTPEQQDQAVRRGERPRVVLATNVAETSVTLDGITRVIDSGVARVLRHDPGTGVDRLVTERISRASAEQRAGRAGRQGPGRCRRLLTPGEFREMADALEPEVLRVDLCEAVLLLKTWGTADVLSFPWPTPPEPAALRRATRLLTRLGALGTEDGPVTDLGRRMAQLPVHPRIGRMLLAVRALGGGDDDGAWLAALAQARPRRRRGAPAGPAGRSDLLWLLDVCREGGGAEPVLDRRDLRSIAREQAQLARLLRRDGGERSEPAGVDVGDHEEALLRCVLAGFPDRVARRRRAGKPEGLMVGGIAVVLDPSSVVQDAELYCAIDAAVGAGGRGGSRATRVTIASAIEEEWLEETHPGSVRDVVETVWNEAKERAEGRETRLFLDLPLRSRPSSEPPDPEEAEALLLRAATEPRALEAFAKDPALATTRARLELLRRTRPDLELPGGGGGGDEEELIAAVRAACHGRRAMAEVRRTSLGRALVQSSPDAIRHLDRLLPERIVLPSGRAAPITYRSGQEPLVSAKLQEFFGTDAAPRIADGRIGLAVDLLAPNGRSVQITTDLGSFWRNLYPRERRELMRRYPRHPWPEDPLSARPTGRPLPRRR